MGSAFTIRLPFVRNRSTDIKAYTKEGAKAQVGGKKEKLLTVLAQAVRAAGAGGFVRDPVFGDAEEGAVVEGEGAAVEGAGTGGGE